MLARSIFFHVTGRMKRSVLFRYNTKAPAHFGPRIALAGVKERRCRLPART